MKTILRSLILLALVALWPAAEAAAQGCLPATTGLVCMTRTTLSANASESATTIQVASATGFSVGNKIWIDFEQLHIVAISGTTITVRRGDNGTAARAHDSGDAAWTGAATGGPTGAGHFNTRDPDFGEDCVRAQGQATHLPWINVRSGWMWSCDNGSTGDWTATVKPSLTVNSEPTSF